MNATTNHDDQPEAVLSSRLRTHLDAATADLPAPAGVHHAIARARSRRRARRSVVACAAAVALVAAVVQVAADDGDGRSLTTAADTARIDPRLTLDWTTHPDGLFFPRQSDAGPLGLYALSTAPGTRSTDFPDGDVPRALYRLADDGRWQAISLDGDDPVVAGISQRDDALYALSTGTSATRDNQPRGSVSTDGGETWATVPLGEFAPPSDDVTWQTFHGLDIASTADATLAVVTTRVFVDRSDLTDLFPELRTAEPFDTRHGPEGIELRRRTAGDEDGELVRTVPWSDLGVTSPEAIEPRTHAYLADAETWTPVELPVMPPVNGQLDVTATGDRLLLLATDHHDDGTSTTVVRTSTDGRRWEQAPDSEGPILATGAGLLRFPTPDAPSLVEVSHDLGATWERLDLRHLDPALAELPEGTYFQPASGPMGVALAASTGTGDVPLVVFSPDLRSWTVSLPGDAMPDGMVLGGLVVGADRVLLTAHNPEGSPDRTATLVAVPRRS